jgi:hypothetical protein
MDGYVVDGYALLGGLLAEFGLTADQVTRVDIQPAEVTVHYLLLKDGKPYRSDSGDIASGQMSVPMSWSRK